MSVHPCLCYSTHVKLSGQCTGISSLLWPCRFHGLDVRPGSKCLIYYSWNIRNNPLHSFFFFLRFVLFIIFSYIFICLCTLSAGALRGQRHQIRSGIEVSGNVSLPNWELVTELRSWCKSSMCSQLRSHHSSPCNFLHSYKYLFRHLLIIAEHFSVPCFVFYAKKSTKTCI